ncbi:MAG: TPM domain-containing protein [Bacteroidetes bacterium]|nr:TPM domain-containing protein [Bacteroidota bacterium]
MFSFFKPKQHKFFSAEEEAKIVEAIRLAEQNTSGELRLYIERKNRFVDPLDRAAEIFMQLKMYETANRNAVLIYVATVHHELAVFADEGIYQKSGQEFWNNAVRNMISEFKKDNYTEGIIDIIQKTGQSLSTHFPYVSSTDKNELPDDIVFGR